MQIRHFLPLPVSDINFFLLTKCSKSLIAKRYFVTSTILSCDVCSFNCVEKRAIYNFVFQNVIIKQLQRKKKRKKQGLHSSICCQNQLTTECIENYGERQVSTKNNYANI